MRAEGRADGDGGPEDPLQGRQWEGAGREHAGSRGQAAPPGGTSQAGCGPGDSGQTQEGEVGHGFCGKAGVQARPPGPLRVPCRPRRP